MKDKLALHQYVLFGVLLVLLFVKVLTGTFFFGLETLWWLLGSMLGFIFVFLDRFFYSFLMKPEEAMAVKLKDLFEKKRFSEGLLMLLSERYEQKELMMRSVLFLMVWIVLAIMTVTSISSPFGRGFVLGIGVHLLFDFLHDYYYNRERFGLWFWQIKREIGVEEKRWFVIIISSVFALLILTF